MEEASQKTPRGRSQEETWKPDPGCRSAQRAHGRAGAAEQPGDRRRCWRRGAEVVQAE